MPKSMLPVALTQRIQTPLLLLLFLFLSKHLLEKVLSKLTIEEFITASKHQNHNRPALCSSRLEGSSKVASILIMVCLLLPPPKDEFRYLDEILVYKQIVVFLSASSSNLHLHSVETKKK
jgi:hypothetical protein